MTRQKKVRQKLQKQPSCLWCVRALSCKSQMPRIGCCFTLHFHWKLVECKPSLNRIPKYLSVSSPSRIAGHKSGIHPRLSLSYFWILASSLRHGLLGYWYTFKITNIKVVLALWGLLDYPQHTQSDYVFLRPVYWRTDQQHWPTLSVNLWVPAAALWQGVQSPSLQIKQM